MSNNTKKIVLITGATAGIGKQTALDLLERGHQVFVTGRNQQGLDELRQLATRMGAEDRCHCLPLDVTSQPSIDAAQRAVSERTNGRGLDVLINNAGYATAGPMMEIDADTLQAQFDTNVFGLMRVTRTFGEEMMVRRRGRIINVGSVSGRVPAPMLGAYHATKYALEAITDALRMEMRGFGIDVVMIEPGTIRTEFAARVLREAEAARAGETRYRDVYERQAELAARFERMAASPEVVSRALVRATETRRAPIRIVAPGRFLIVIALIKILPTRWVDQLMRRIAGLRTHPRLTDSSPV